jgi:hypothetical protein
VTRGDSVKWRVDLFKLDRPARAFRNSLVPLVWRSDDRVPYAVELAVEALGS